MKWMQERDLLIAQTVAFVQSVTGKKPDFDRPTAVETTADATSPVINVEAAQAEPAAPAAAPPQVASLPATASAPRQAPVTVAHPAAPPDFRSEIKARVENFRAHQERFTREREEYCRTTLAKVRATLEDDILPSQAAE